jgi:hypothetical protein
MFIILMTTPKSRRRVDPNLRFINMGMPIIHPSRDAAWTWIKAHGSKPYNYRIYELVLAT